MNEPTIKLSNGVVMPFMAMGTNWMKYGELAACNGGWLQCRTESH